MKPDKHVLIGAAILVAVVALMILGRKPRPAKVAVSTPTSAVEKKKKAAPRKDIARKRPEEQALPEIEAAPNSDLTRSEAATGLAGISIDTDAHGTSIPVSIRIQSTCSWGEVDLIKRYSDNGALLGKPDKNGFDLLLSLEPLLPDKSFKGVSVAVPIASVEAGFKHTFVVPPVAQTTPLGLFLCSDGLRQRACRDKASQDLNKLFVQQFRTTERDALTTLEKTMRNHLYFFQLVIASPNRLLVWPKQDFSDGDYRNLRGTLRLALGARSDIDPMVARVKRWNADMRSVAPEVEGGGVDFVLNRYDAQNCAKMPKPLDAGQKLPTIDPKKAPPIDPKRIWHPPAEALKPPGPEIPRYKPSR